MPDLVAISTGAGTLYSAEPRLQPLTSNAAAITANDSVRIVYSLCLPVRPEPRRLLVAGAVGGQLGELALGRLVQIQNPRALGRHCEDIPILGIRSHHFGRRLEGADLARISSAVRPAAEGQQFPIWRPVDVVDLVRLIHDLHDSRANGRSFRVQVDRRGCQLMIAGSPGDVLAIGADARPAAGNLQVDDASAVRFDQQGPMADTHSGM